MTGDVMAELARLRHYASGLRTMLADAQSEAPSRAEGADRSGKVRATVGADGLPESFRVEAGWHRALEPSKFGAAVVEAAQAAAGERLAVWTRTLRQRGWQKKVDQLRGDDPVTPVVGVVPPAFRREQPPRPLGVLAEEVMNALDGVVGMPAPVPATGTGSVASGKLVVLMSKTGLVSCDADPEWVAQQSATQLTNHLGDALRAAREAMPAANPGPAGNSPLDSLFAEIMAVMGDPDRLRT
ncbi:hypothetical protein ACTG9Q_19885 [Actinokineospora sp. 24-640]